MWIVSSFEPSLSLAPTVRWYAALALASIGAAFDLLGLIAFRRAKTTLNPLRPDKASALVTGSIYRITRNPMYVGLALLLIAWAVYLSALWPFLGPAIFVFYIDRFQITPEERVMRGKFGAEYAAYAARVRRWL